MAKRILISDKVHPLLTDGLEKEGFEVNYQPKMPYGKVCEQVKKYDGIIINSKVICDQKFIDNARHLDFIGRLGSGLDIIDLPYAKVSGIEVISSPEGNANAVAEHALGMLLSLHHSIGISHQDLIRENWNREPNRGTELGGKVVGIVGYGHTGPAFAERLKGLNVDILVCDKYKNNLSRQKERITQVDLDTLVQTSDIVSIHLPLTNETQRLVDESFLAQMKSEAIIINTSRGNILDSGALLNALESDHLGGACLDVLENEKPETWSEAEKRTYTGLLKRKNVIITPHIAGWTHQSLKLIASILLKKICKFYEV